MLSDTDLGLLQHGMTIATIQAMGSCEQGEQMLVSRVRVKLVTFSFTAGSGGSAHLLHNSGDGVSM